jgi:hypothetical protein
MRKTPEESADRFRGDRGISGERLVLSRREHGMRRRIISILRQGPRTIPELAEGLGIESHEAMWWMMGYVRYGYVSPTGEVTDEGYHRYSLTEGED